MKGPDVLAAQKLLLKNPFGSFNPGKLDSEYGEITAGAVIRAKWELGFPATARSSTFGPNLKAYLAGKKPLPAAFKARRATRLKQATSQQAIRKRIVNWALWGCKNTAQIGYSQNGNLRLAALGKKAARCRSRPTARPSRRSATRGPARRTPMRRARTTRGSRPTRARCSSHCRRIPRSAVQPGDLVVWTPPRVGQHVCLVIQRGADPLLVSHGDESGPKKLRFSAEDDYQRRHGHGTAVLLSAF